MRAVDEASRARAEHRRRTWTGGVAHSFEEMEELDLDFWLAATSSERMCAVCTLMDELRLLKGDHGPTPRLQRAVGGVRERAR